MISSYLKNKLFFLSKIIFVYLILSIYSYSENLNINNSLIVLGSDKAEVKVKIFSSFTCPHCANFHFTVVPKLKKECFSPPSKNELGLGDPHGGCL